MAFNPLSIFTGAAKAAAGFVGSITGLIDEVSTTDEEKRVLINSAAKIAADFELKMEGLSNNALQAIVSLELAATKSEDKYVRRARPTGLYIAYAVTGILALTQTALLIIAVIQGTEPIWLDTGAIATLLIPLYGNAMWYTHNRTKEKVEK